MTGMGSLNFNAAPTCSQACRPRRQPFRCQFKCQAMSALSQKNSGEANKPDRRRILSQIASLAAALTVSWETAALATSLPVEAQDDNKLLCNAECMKTIDDIKTVNLPSGLQYKEIKEGTGPIPPVGFQVVANYVAMVPNGTIFDNSLEKGKPYDVRVGAGQVIPGLDEGMKSMKVGGIRRLYIPGNLAFPKGLSSGPGRPRVPPKSPVVFDVELVYVPGLDEE
ncbi:TPA: hypothetical protein ACH3X2_008204 [Trebouxia sp. C0005]|nr:MAG: putative FKBP-type peptidyl-prolyl cis-trans isomerase chloroplastic-like [Trebouxia sp. A1-2]